MDTQEAFEDWAKGVDLDLTKAPDAEYWDSDTAYSQMAWDAALVWARSTGLIPSPTGTQSLFGEEDG